MSPKNPCPHLLVSVRSSWVVPSTDVEIYLCCVIRLDDTWSYASCLPVIRYLIYSIGSLQAKWASVITTSPVSLVYIHIYIGLAYHIEPLQGKLVNVRMANILDIILLAFIKIRIRCALFIPCSLHKSVFEIPFPSFSLSPSFVRLEPINLKKEKKNRGRESWPFLCPVSVWRSVKRVWYLEERDRSQIKGDGWVQARSWKPMKSTGLATSAENNNNHSWKSRCSRVCGCIFRIAWRCRVKKRIELIRGEWHGTSLSLSLSLAKTRPTSVVLSLLLSTGSQWRRPSEGKVSNYATDMVRAILIKKETKMVVVQGSVPASGRIGWKTITLSTVTSTGWTVEMNLGQGQNVSAPILSYQVFSTALS